MVEDYLCTDGLPITLSPLYQGDEVYENIFKNRDPRLGKPFYTLMINLTIIMSIGAMRVSYRRVTGVTGGNTTNTGYHIIKNYEVSRFRIANGTEETPALVLRLGEAMLNYAEAKAELGTITQTHWI